SEASVSAPTVCAVVLWAVGELARGGAVDLLVVLPVGGVHVALAVHLEDAQRADVDQGVDRRGDLADGDGLVERIEGRTDEAGVSSSVAVVVEVGPDPGERPPGEEVDARQALAQEGVR